MLIFEDKNDLKLVQPVASASTMIGSLAGIMRDFVLERFPEKYFRHVYINSEETVVEHHKTKKYNENVYKIPYPSLSIETEISLDDPVGGMDKSRQLSSTNLFLNKDLRRTYKKLLVDPSRKFSVYFASDYITVNFNFKIALKKYIQNLDLAYYMKSRFQTEFFQFMNDQEVEVELPKTFVTAIADYKNLDISTSEEMRKLQDFLASCSTQDTFIKKKKNLSTGNDCFFFGHKVNLLLYMTDLDAPSSVIRNRMNDDEYVVSFRIQVSTWLPNAFILSVDNSLITEFSETTFSAFRMSRDNTELSDGYLAASIPSSFELGRELNINFLNSSGETAVAHEVLNEILTYKTTDTREQYFSFFNNGLKDDLIKAHSYLLTKNMFVSDVFQIRVLDKNGNESFQYSIDYDDLSITFTSNYQEEVFVSLFVDRTALAAVLKAIETTEFYFNRNALAVVRITTGGMDFKARIYSFSSNIEHYSTDILKSVRTETIYGTGYIGLVDEDHPNASEYKIYLGNDINGNPIIKCFELEL